MLTEREALRLWQKLFRGQTITALTLSEAGTVIDDLPLDSPVRIRLATELDELKHMRETQP